MTDKTFVCNYADILTFKLLCKYFQASENYLNDKLLKLTFD